MSARTRYECWPTLTSVILSYKNCLTTVLLACDSSLQTPKPNSPQSEPQSLNQCLGISEPGYLTRDPMTLGPYPLYVGCSLTAEVQPCRYRRWPCMQYLAPLHMVDGMSGVAPGGAGLALCMFTAKACCSTKLHSAL